MKLTRSIAVLGGLGVASIALIGAGASAVFTQNTVSSQQITAGTMNVVLSASGATGNGTSAITFANLAPVNSSFTTGDEVVTITNDSNIPVTEIEATPGDSFDSSGGSTSANSLFAGEAYLCEVSSGEVIYNGLLSAAPAQSIAGTLAVGGTDNYTMNIYAGSTALTACGAVTSAGSTAPAGDAANPAAVSLAQGAQGGVINPSMTVTYNG
jgi:predicted ribosomally synthesized peptide with SipW-like signal peptide